MRLGLSYWRYTTALLLLVGLAACSGGRDSGPAHPPAPPSLYSRLGGEPALRGAIDDFMTNAAADPRIARRFRTIDQTHFKAALAEQLCVSTGGPCHYTGRPMKDVHAGMGISNAEFNAMTQDLRHAMANRGVSVDLQVEVAAALEPMRDDIVSPVPPAESVVISQMVKRPAAKTTAKTTVAKKTTAKYAVAPTAKKKAPVAKKPVAKKPAPKKPASSDTGG